MIDWIRCVKPTFFLWIVLLVRLAAFRESPAWEAVPLGVLLIIEPLLSRILDTHVFRRSALEAEVAELKARVTDTQNRMASLSLAAGLKRG